MKTSEYIPRPQGIARPKCFKCGAQMRLARIEPDAASYDKRTFECPECDNVRTEIVKFR